MSLCISCSIRRRWIVDMSIAVERRAITVLLSSPDRPRFKEFVSLLGATRLYMPIWTDEEIHICRYAQPWVLQTHLPMEAFMPLVKLCPR